MFWKSSNNSILEIKSKSGTDKFVSIFGKSTVRPDSQSYIFTKEITRHLIENGYGVIHGGYAGGLMQAVADEAHETLIRLKLPKERNIAIPQTQHDSVGWKRVPNAMFTKPALDVYDRLRTMVTNSDFVVIGPRGGDGTMLELITVWHENVIAEASHGKVTPIVVLESNEGTDWRRILSTLVDSLDNSYASMNDIPWLHFARNNEDITKYLKL
jgi:predicted Rossmann-fold nucleotide-binding protein